MSFVGIANSLMSAFLLSYFPPSWRRGRFLINKERLFGNKERLLENKAGLLIGFFENISYLCSVIRMTNSGMGPPDVAGLGINIIPQKTTHYD